MTELPSTSVAAGKAIFPAEALVESADALVELLRNGDSVTPAVRGEIWITLYRFAANARETAHRKAKVIR